jgi:hypothetical protein
MIIWGREDEVFDAATFSKRFKRMIPHADGPNLGIAPARAALRGAMEGEDIGV